MSFSDKWIFLYPFRKVDISVSIQTSGHFSVHSDRWTFLCPFTQVDITHLHKQVFLCPFTQGDGFKPRLPSTERSSTASPSDGSPPLSHLLLPNLGAGTGWEVPGEPRPGWVELWAHGMAVGRSVHSLSQQNRERSSQGQLTNRYKAKRQRDRNLEASHQ